VTATRRVLDLGAPDVLERAAEYAKRRPSGLQSRPIEQLIRERDEAAEDIRAHGGTPGVFPGSRKMDAALLRWVLYVGLQAEIDAREAAS
jgi:hypothetical protein